MIMRRQWKQWTAFGILVLVGLSVWTLFLQPLWLLTTLSPLICPQAVYAIATDQSVVALTIDDGPDISTTVDQSTTSQMLDVLAEYQAQATFFLISQKLEDSATGMAIAQRIVNDGHELGNHFTQDIRSITVSETDFSQGLQQAEQTLSRLSNGAREQGSKGVFQRPSKIQNPKSKINPPLTPPQRGTGVFQRPSKIQNPKSKINPPLTSPQRRTGVFQRPSKIQNPKSKINPPLTPLWFRPAGGWCSHSNAQTTQARGYQTALGSIWPYDTHLPSVSFARQQILRTVHPGAIIILHDAAKNDGESDRGQRAVQILQTVLPELQDRGYTVTTLSDLATYGPMMSNQQVLPPPIDRIWQRIVAGGVESGFSTRPTARQWGMAAAISMVGAIAILIIGFRTQFLRHQWAIPDPHQSIPRFYCQVIAKTFFFPALAEEFIFRLLLLPGPREITDVFPHRQWIECLASLVIYVVVHPLVTGPLQDWMSIKRTGQQTEQQSGPLGRNDGETDEAEGYDGNKEQRSLDYTHTFRRPTFLILATIVGIVCTVLYLLSNSIWPPLLFHWWVVIGWLLTLNGYQMLHPAVNSKQR